MDIRVIGVGNVFMSDAGFGPYVVRVLEALYELPANVQVVDAGLPGLDLAPHLHSADAVIVIETVTGGGRAGEVRAFRCDRGLHLGMVPEWVATGVRLSQPVRAAITPVIGLILTELERLGVGVRCRLSPRHPDTWWERGEDIAAHRYAGV